MSPSLLLLILYPLVSIGAPAVFFRLWPEKRSAVRNLPAARATKREKAATAHVWALVSLFTYAILACGALLWQLFFSAEPARVGFSTKPAVHSALVGGYLGVSWAGISVWLLALGAATGRMRREIPALMTSLKLQIPVWLAGALGEEMWRVAAIAALMASRNSPLLSIVVVAVVYGSGYLRLGFQRTAVAILEGVFFGFLFLWRSSFFAPFTAHLAVGSVYLWGVGQMSQDRQRRKTWQIPGTRCPVCHMDLKLLQIKLTDVFECPSCKEPLSLSDGYQNVLRFTGALGFFSLLICSLSLLIHWLPENLAICLSYPVTYGAATSGLFLYRRAFTRLFPPRLQRGTPYFITLSLGSRSESKKSKGEDDDGT